MRSVSAISLSGMSAAQTALGASAHNIANLATVGFRREQAVQASAASGGVTATLTPAAWEGGALERDLVDQAAARNLFRANLAVFKTGDSMLGALLDTRG
jgi:flagellar hook protein FlgE